MTETFIDEMEDTAQVVADSMFILLDSVLESIAPDGRPFLMEPLSDEEQVSNYLQLRGNVEAWNSWVSERANEIINRLTNAGVPTEQVAAVQPFKIAEAFAVDFSVRMEEKLKAAAANG